MLFTSEVVQTLCLFCLTLQMNLYVIRGEGCLIGPV